MIYDEIVFLHTHMPVIVLVHYAVHNEPRSPSLVAAGVPLGWRRVS